MSLEKENFEENLAKNKEGKIEQLNDSLYDPDAPEINKVFKRDLSAEEVEEGKVTLQREWQNNQINSSSKFRSALEWTTREQPVFKKILWIALGFFILSFLVASFLYFRGINSVSPNKIDITLAGPLAVSASNPWTLDITIKNRNNADLSNADVLISYPEGTREIENTSKPLVADLQAIGTVEAGGELKRRSEAVLFGEEGEMKKIKVTFHYKVPGSTSVFKKEAQYDVLINSAPVTVSIDSVKELNSNQQISFNVKVTSNSNNVLKNIAIVPDFPPFGFTLENSSPALVEGKWILEQLAPAETKEFKITGRLRGERDEQKYFKFAIGSIDPLNPQRLSTEFVTVEKLVTLKLPFISSLIEFDSARGRENVADRGGVLRGSISYINNLSVPIESMELRMALKDSNLINKEDIQVSEGFYSSVENVLIWNKLSNSRFESIAPGQSGKVGFSLPFRDPNSADNNKNLKNLSVLLDLTLVGNRLSENNVPERITSVDSKTIKISTETNLTSKVLYYTGPLKNTGGLPPRANLPTTYTVLWTLTNSLNDVRNSIVTATLPPHVTFEGTIFPTTEKVTFDQNTNQVKWDVGTLFAGEGFRSKEKQVAFKIILTPSENQIFSGPFLIRDTHFDGIDAFTELPITDKVDDQTTHILQDPTYKTGEDKVVE